MWRFGRFTVGRNGKKVKGEDSINAGKKKYDVRADINLVEHLPQSWRFNAQGTRLAFAYYY
jgi:hypothetical protein